MTSLIEHAESELRALPGKRDNARIMLERDVVALVGLFSAQRHSGSSAAFVARALEKLLRWGKLDPAHSNQAIMDSALIGRLTTAHQAIEEAAAWHERQEKALSDQPSNGDLAWRRNEHREQAELLRAASASPSPARASGSRKTESDTWVRRR